MFGKRRLHLFNRTHHRPLVSVEQIASHPKVVTNVPTTPFQPPHIENDSEVSVVGWQGSSGSDAASFGQESCTSESTLVTSTQTDDTRSEKGLFGGSFVSSSTAEFPAQNLTPTTSVRGPNTSDDRLHRFSIIHNDLEATQAEAENDTLPPDQYTSIPQSSSAAVIDRSCNDDGGSNTSISMFTHLSAFSNIELLFKFQCVKSA